MLKLYPFKTSYYNFKLNSKYTLDYNENASDFYWILDNTDEIQNNKKQEMEEEINSYIIKKNNFTDNYNNIIKEDLRIVKKQKEDFFNRKGDIIYIIQENEIRNMMLFFDNYIYIIEYLIINVFNYISKVYNDNIYLYRQLIHNVEKNKFFDRNDIDSEKNKIVNILNNLDIEKFKYPNTNDVYTYVNIFNKYKENLDNDISKQLNSINNRVNKKQEEEKKEEILKKEEENIKKIIIDDNLVKWYEFKNDSFLNEPEIKNISLIAKKDIQFNYFLNFMMKIIMKSLV